MSYGVCNKLFGIVWRGQMRAAHPTAADFTALMSELASWTGIITMVSMCCSKWVFKVRRRHRPG
jgi:ATP/ADP translocase